MINIRRVFRRFRAQPAAAVVVAGTDYQSYQLATRIQQNPAFHLAYFMNEEPWHHRTFILGVELRYASELLSLVKKHDIKAVFCASEDDYHSWLSDMGTALTQHHCQVLLCRPGETPQLPAV